MALIKTLSECDRDGNATALVGKLIVTQRNGKMELGTVKLLEVILKAESRYEKQDAYLFKLQGRFEVVQ